MTNRRSAVAWWTTAICLIGAGCDRSAPQTVDSTSDAGALTTLDEHRARRAELDATVWARERVAQEHERALVALWDALLAANRTGDPAAQADVLASLEFDALRIASPDQVDVLEHGIARGGFADPESVLTAAQWSEMVKRLAAEGFELVQSEWHHARFWPKADASSARSEVAVVLHVIDRPRARRWIVDGALTVEWTDRRDARGIPIPETIDATGLRWLSRSGPPGFERMGGYKLRRNRRLARLHPIVAYDLDRDGLTDIAMLGAGRVLWNRGEGDFEEAELFEHPYELAEAGVIADLNGDGHPDLMAARRRGDVAVYLGNEAGRFPDEPNITPQLDERLRGPSMMTAGDIDGDGDLDVWLAQYKPPYIFGQMPTPYFDANDGWPSYLLLNDGVGQFLPVTEEAGLGEKRFRRTYASCFVDLDEDADLDLLVVSDFSGIDVYHNDGRGRFTDGNSSVKADRHLFGMSAAFADYDLDGRQDFFVAGMASTTARRLEAAGLARDDMPDFRQMRMRMAYGNRMYMARAEGWGEPEFHADVARTGWTWGTTAFDFDNDGDPDIFAANGNESGESTKDYCVNFWCHDIYEGDGRPNEELSNLFTEKLAGFAQGKESWDGYQKNHLLMNRAGRGFVNVAFLMGVADEFDSRSAISEDLDLDGRVDLIVVEDLGIKGQRLHLYRNQLETEGTWIGVRLEEEGSGVSPNGATIRVRTDAGTHFRHIMTGESVMGQHSPNAHFGLGAATKVDSIEVRWINGTSRVLDAPEIGRYYRVRPSVDPPR